MTAETLLLERGNAGQRLPCFQAALKGFRSSGVGQVEMLEYLGGAPLPFQLAGEFLVGHTPGGGGYGLLQTCQIRIHGPSDCSL